MVEHPKETQIPLILTAAGLALYVVAAFVRTGAGGVGATLTAVLIGAAIQTVLLVVIALIVGTLMSVSFGSIGSAALKFAAASIASGGIAALLPGGGIVALFVFLGLVMWLFEIELTYAVVLTVVYLFVSFGIVFVMRNA